MKTKYDWSNVPDDVKWIATDGDGCVFGYSNKPELIQYVWHKKYFNDCVFSLNIAAYNGLYQDSLEERPNEN